MENKTIGIIDLLDLLYDSKIILNNEIIEYDSKNLKFDFHNKTIIYNDKKNKYNIVLNDKVNKIKVIKDKYIVNIDNLQIKESQLLINDLYEYLYMINKFKNNKHIYHRNTIMIKNKKIIEDLEEKYNKVSKIKNISDIFTNIVLSTLMYPNENIIKEFNKNKRIVVNEISKIINENYFDIIMDSSYLKYILNNYNTQ